MDLVRKSFYWLFPAIPKKVWNKEGENMQSIMLVQTILHFIFFVVNLVFVGFYPMLMDLGYMIFAFTNYLNIREYMVIIYMLSLVSGACYKFQFNVRVSSTSLLFYVFEIAFLILSTIYVLKIYLAFRDVGGRKEKYIKVNKHAKNVVGLVSSTAAQVNDKARD